MHVTNSEIVSRISMHQESTQLFDSVKVIGRADEKDLVQNLVKKAISDDKQLLLVHGEPGSGKTTLILHEIKGVYASDSIICNLKYGQYSGDDPNTTVSQLLQPILQHMLSQHGPELNTIKKIMRSELGENAALINSLLPGFHLVCDCSVIPATLPVRESEKRLVLALSKFIEIVASRVKLVIFYLDDIQWANSGSLSLILEVLTTVSNNLLLIVTYRTREISAESLGTLYRLNGEKHEIEVKPFEKNEIKLFVQTNYQEVSSSLSESDIDGIWELTKGNPLHLSRLLESVVATNVHGEDVQRPISNWSRELQNIVESNPSLLDLLKNQIGKLTENQKVMLGASACLGQYFNFRNLAELNYDSIDIQKNLKIFQTNGFLIKNKVGDSPAPDGHNIYSFIHDKIQQAAAQTLTSQESQAIHQTIGQSLLRAPVDYPDDSFPFEKLNSLNRSVDLVDSKKELLHIAQLNLKAAQVAKLNSANGAAISYLDKINILIDETWWIDHKDIVIDTYFQLAELLHGTGKADESEEMLKRILPYFRSKNEHGKYLNLLICIKNSQSDYESAIEIGRTALMIWDIKLPTVSVEAEVQTELAISRKLCTTDEIQKITKNIPESENTELRVLMNLLINLLPSTDAIDPDLNRWVSVKMVNLTMTEGYTSESAKAFVNYGVTVCLQNEMEWGNQLGKQALRFQALSKAPLLAHRVQFTYLTYLKHWKEPLHETLNDIEGNRDSALKSGDELYAGFSIGMTGSLTRLYLDQPLSLTEQQLGSALDYCKGTANVSSELLCLSTLTAIKYLRSDDTDNTQFQYEGLSESDLLRRCESEGSPMPICILRVLQAYIFVLEGKVDSASYAIEAAVKSIDSLYSTMPSAICIFLRGFIASQQIQASSQQNSKQYEILKSCRQTMDQYAIGCPHNFFHLAKILEAEQQVLTGDTYGALETYLESVNSSIKSGFCMYGALAHERLADIWNTLGNQNYRKAHIGQASLLYRKWGAIRKVRSLDTSYDWVYSDTQIFASPGSWDEKAFDLTALKAVADSISGELDYKVHVQQLLTAIGNYSSASFVAFVMDLESELQIEAIFENSQTTHLGLKISDNKFEDVLPSKIINYTSRMNKPFSVSAPLDHAQYSNEKVIKNRCPSLINCIPVTLQHELVGLVYIEHSNKHTPLLEHVIEVLKIMSTQTLISLRNINMRNAMESIIDSKTDELEKANLTLKNRLEVQDSEINQLNRLKQFLPPQVADIVVSSNGNKLLNSHRRQIAVVFCDLRGFTAYSESVEPEESISLLSRYHEVLGRLITKYEATIDHRAGDGIMVFLGDPLQIENPAQRAVEMCAEMRKDVGVLLSDVHRRALNLGFGIGISYGFATIGKVGYSGGYGYSATGRYVNLASRLCDIAKDGEMLVSMSVHAELDSSGLKGMENEIDVAGFTQPIRVFSIFSDPKNV